MDAMIAHRQWASRPVDERFTTLEAMYQAARHKRTVSNEVNLPLNEIAFEAMDETALAMKVGTQTLAISNYAFGQFASTRVGISANAIVGKLNAPISADVLNYRIKRTIEEANETPEVSVFMDSESRIVRSVNSPVYSRIHDADIIPFAQVMEQMGFINLPARPITNDQPGVFVLSPEDIARYGGATFMQAGEVAVPSGLYMGDRDMFIFMVHPRSGKDDGIGNPLFKGYVMMNSEVGARKVSLFEFLCQGACGNHIIWGMREVTNYRRRHVGNAVEETVRVMRDAVNNVTLNNDLSRELIVFEWMRNNKLGINHDTVVEAVYKMDLSPLHTQKYLSNVYANAERFRDVDGDPNTWYGFANAMTRYNQISGNADRRYELDMAAGKLFEKASKLASA